jgi:hypothetical protein
MSACERIYEMADEIDVHERHVRRRLMTYADAAVGDTAVDHRAIARRARARSTPAVPLGTLVLVLLAVGALALLARAPVPNAGSDLARAPASSCAAGDWPSPAISCDTVFRLGDQAGARVDRARVWLTTLGAVKAAMNPARQVSEPAEAAEVWVVVYDGRWRCCPNAFDENGNLIPQVDQTRWLVVAEAAREGTGFIYLQDWSGKPVPDRLPLPDRGAATCSDWAAMTDGQRMALADQIVGDSADTLDRVRIRQHQPIGTPRDVLVLDVVQSLTKMCDAWAPRDRPVAEVFEALYAE